MEDKFKQLSVLIGQAVEKEDSSALYQCMDFAFAWVDILGIDRATIRHEFAYQVYTQPNDLTVQNFCIVPNTQNGIPQKGDLVVFDHDISGVTGNAGHICTATGEGDTNLFHSLDQNWDGVLHVTEETHSYIGVLGFLRIKQDSQLQSRFDAKNKAYDELYATDQDNLHTISQNKDVISNQQVLIEQKNADITSLNAKTTTLETQLTASQQQVTTLEPIARQVPSLQDQVTQADTKIQGMRDEITSLTQSNSQLKNTSAWGISKRDLLQIFIKRLVGVAR